MSTSRRGYPEDVAEHDRYWLAGLLEGEGSFLKGPPSAPRYPVLSLQMTDEDVVARVAAMLGRKMGCLASSGRALAADVSGTHHRRKGRGVDDGAAPADG